MKIVKFRFNEEEYKIWVYKFDWEWHDDNIPVNESVRLEKAAEECAKEEGMIRLT